jgi:hypothetical protein
MNLIFDKPDTCILLHGQVRLIDTNHNSFNEMLSYHKTMCGSNRMAMHLWEEDYQKYKEEIKTKHNFVVCNETEPAYTDEELQSFKQAIINFGCNPSIADDAVFRLTKEDFGLGQSVNKSLEKDYKFFIKARYDLIYKRNFDIDKYKTLLDQDCPVVIMPVGEWGSTNFVRGCQNMFYVMNRLAAESMSNFNLTQLERAKNNKVVGTEAGLRFHFKENNAKLYRINFPVSVKKWLDSNVWYSPDINQDNYFSEELL